ncbi:MAG: rhodanese-like domain-containing protein [Planctomycetes bacterium]|nr:rhodanese-like domain-containing protein [Planctomycetota bacterium]
MRPAAPPHVDVPPGARSDPAPVSYRDLDPAAAHNELQADPTLRILDVRTEAEYQSHRLPNAVLVPVQDLARRLHELDRDANWLVHCEHGRRSLWACDLLAQAGFARLANLRGGLAHWAGCGLPFERGPRAG